MLQFGKVICLVPVVFQIAELEAFLLKMRYDGWIEVIGIACQHNSRDSGVPAQMHASAASSHPLPDVLLGFRNVNFAICGDEVDVGKSADIYSDHFGSYGG